MQYQSKTKNPDFLPHHHQPSAFTGLSSHFFCAKHRFFSIPLKYLLTTRCSIPIVQQVFRVASVHVVGGSLFGCCEATDCLSVHGFLFHRTNVACRKKPMAQYCPLGAQSVSCCFFTNDQPAAFTSETGMIRQAVQPMSLYIAIHPPGNRGDGGDAGGRAGTGRWTLTTAVGQVSACLYHAVCGCARQTHLPSCKTAEDQRKSVRQCMHCNNK